MAKTKLFLLSNFVVSLMTLGSLASANNVIPLFPNAANPTEESYLRFVERLTGTFKSHEGVLITVEVSEENGRIVAKALEPHIDKVYVPDFFDLDSTGSNYREPKPKLHTHERTEYNVHFPHKITRIKTTRSPRFKTVRTVRISLSNPEDLIHSYSKVHYRRPFFSNGPWHPVEIGPKNDPSVEYQETLYSRVDSTPIDLEALAKHRAEVVRPRLRSSNEAKATPLDGSGVVISIDFSPRTSSCKSFL